MGIALTLVVAMVVVVTRGGASADGARDGAGGGGGAETGAAAPGSPVAAPTDDGATYVRAARQEAGWLVERSDGSSFTIDPVEDRSAVALGLSPDGRWLSYLQARRPGGPNDLYLLRSDRTEPERVEGVAAAPGFAHRWSTDSRLVLVPAVDGGVAFVDTDATRVSGPTPPGVTGGFVDTDSIGWVRALGEGGTDGLAWVVTGPGLEPGYDVPLAVGAAELAPAGWSGLAVRQASLAPDGSRLAVLLADDGGRARTLLFSAYDGSLVGSGDGSEASLDLSCPPRWVDGRLEVLRQGEPCVIPVG
ncbi:hypothetical protein [Nocardioides sp. YIM 152588]|uniref:hypothetical protein n=1 Tax=Nocardioides sp. YIM 152588 TaxID=3158259 RepID=UPI0032E4305B